LVSKVCKSFEEKLTIPSLIGELQDCFKISLNDLQQDYLGLIESEGTLFNETFDYNALEFLDTHISYKGMKFKKVVFSEGWKVLDNPFFENTPFSPSKGELLLVEIPGLKLRKAFKKSMFITPLINDLYWVGATYEWQNFDPTPTETMKKRVLKAFEEMIQIPYTIKQHLSGIRPSSKDRRPVIGPSAVDSRVFTFNGMGTKGSSLAPYFSKVLFDHMYDNKLIPKEVHLDRFTD